MAAPILRHYNASNPTTANTVFQVAPAVPAGRSLVVSKVVASTLSSGTAQELTLYAGATSAIESIFAYTLLGGYEVYTESGLVLVAGQLLFARSSIAGATMSVHVFGQEVDN